MNPKSLHKIILFIALSIAIISIYILIFMQAPAKPIAGQGTLLEKGAKIGGEFTLTDHNGKIFSSENLKGKPSLIYFGFTFCPDICPTSLQKIGEVLSVLDKYQLDVNPVFITIDPERDSIIILKEYLGHFHPKFIGLTGNEEAIKIVADKFKVFYSKSQAESKDAPYMMDHSSFIYYLDKNGEFIKLFYMSSSPEEIIEFIRMNYNNYSKTSLILGIYFKSGAAERSDYVSTTGTCKNECPKSSYSILTLDRTFILKAKLRSVGNYVSTAETCENERLIQG